MREDLSSEFPTMQDSNQPAQLKRLARKLASSKFINYASQRANNKCADQTARMCRLVCALNLQMQLRQVLDTAHKYDIFHFNNCIVFSMFSHLG